ncbi:hypothetical protein [Psychromonas aquimarina]|uniref:hypothetical protein n=1 Tax=Psychromonas aquimarina TaxID=444919 RepID=UPI0004125780|nr:hypothetical protein [Psychromonas aquimarina]
MDVSTLALNVQSLTDLTFQLEPQALTSAAETESIADYPSEITLQAELLVMKLLIEHMTGKSIELSEHRSKPESRVSAVQSSRLSTLTVHGQVESLEGQSAALDFEITAELNVNMSRRELQMNETSELQLTDPLVINLGREFADLDNAKFHFDLDADGDKDWVPKLAAGSAFLALDKNANSRIDDGSELFGPQSGNGFVDLAKFDDNADQVIDSRDSVYAQLKVWRPGGELLAAADVGISSISLQAVQDVREYRNEQGQLLGMAQKSAEFTRENGSTGRVQHIDMMI